MAVSGMFLTCFGIYRIFVEFFRQPDAHLGYIAFGWLTQGQILSAPMVLLGIVLLWLAYKKKSAETKSKDSLKSQKNT